MQRREILRGLALASVLPLLPQGAAADPILRRGRIRRARPSDPGWPNADEWAALNKQVGGNLIQPNTLFAACDKASADNACRDVQQSIRNPIYIGDQPGGTEVSGWFDAWTPAASSYAVVARTAAHVAAAVDFARDHRLRLVVKGGGHSYQGTSNAPDSLLVWTRAMNRIALHGEFTPQGSRGRVAPVPAVTAEAGAMWIDLYHAVTTKGGRFVQGGGCTSVGNAGLVQSGGFGSFSKRFGTSAAALLEAQVVTADGRVRTVNAYQDPELFWALKGGGGGSWGVVTKMTLRTFDLPPFFGSVWGGIKAHSDRDFRTLIGRFVDFYAERLFNPNWGEHVILGADNTLRIAMVSQGLGAPQIRAVWKPFADGIRAARAQFTVVAKPGIGVLPARYWWDDEVNTGMVPDPRPGSPAYRAWWQGDGGQAGAYLYGYESLWLPASLLSRARRPRLVEALFNASRHHGLELHFNKGLAGAPPEVIASARDTATNPDVLSAFALAIIAGGQRSAYPDEPGAEVDRQAAGNDAARIARAAAQLRKVAPGAGSYVAESNYFNEHWQTAYWGRNYPRLRAVKAHYDPDGLFFGHNGVGSEDWSRDGFTQLR